MKLRYCYVHETRHPRRRAPGTRRRFESVDQAVEWLKSRRPDATVTSIEPAPNLLGDYDTFTRIWYRGPDYMGVVPVVKSMVNDYFIDSRRSHSSEECFR